ncbi:MAG: hypothetical protein JAY99_16825 [Candidatus Thiodiazotropha lotti]|uniref:hypothetical protein n=1 Tax=Candidatus Thiodiazotropha endoloripes TaxID=1818881 RepID=UPI0009F59A45|nr:hypothetical protein [Candidatus Thiodiazotropha endoloripes]MCG7900403.1 hypothetical protein [Candidatus Thiodiazotropha weberae]MCG7990961.1 hypothetical protein [Candidatus Thiodiazotropha lotti]MCG7903049.1 hypothetical protein [Candidatus Thiodiazotropha weberae]MCG8001185.1 hypothetical protein [Candidatus Thiodiazotropha lotti]MCW4182615.1 hypothetical protein [Candidatus Thiodiazotropha weberae]
MQTIPLKLMISTLLVLFSQNLLAEIENHPSPIDPLLTSSTRAPEQPASSQTAESSEPRFYPRPMGPAFESGDERLNCRQLDQQLASLESDTYSAKPGFYEDPYAGASIFVGAVWAPGALAYLGYSGAAEYYEQDRVSEAQNRIEALRRMKARLRCYEY